MSSRAKMTLAPPLVAAVEYAPWNVSRKHE
jgi:hypothetical protein